MYDKEFWQYGFIPIVGSHGETYYKKAKITYDWNKDELDVDQDFDIRKVWM